ncbi:MAG: hypothetical protein RR825_08855, partial [Ruthenibacterium sp.]
MFDISQTRGRQPQSIDNQQFQPDEMLAALIESSPVRFEIFEQVAVFAQQNAQSSGLCKAPSGIAKQYGGERRQAAENVQAQYI